MASYLISRDDTTKERLILNLPKSVIEEKNELEKRAKDLNFEIPYNEQITVLIEKMNKSVRKDLDALEKKKTDSVQDVKPNERQESNSSQGENSIT